MIVLHCFGPLFLSDHSNRFKTRRKKSLILLAYLLLTGGKRTRHYCCSLLWPDQDEKHGLANLRNAISDVNHACSVKLIHSDQDLIFASPEVKADASRILQAGNALENKKTAELEEILLMLKISNGEFLSGFYNASPDFEDWYFFIRAEIHRAVFLMRKHLLVYFSEKNQINTALQFAILNREANLLDESLHRIIMILYAMKGDLSEVIHQFNYCKTVITRESDREIEENTRELYDYLRIEWNHRNRDVLIRQLEGETGIAISSNSVKSGYYIPESPSNPMGRHFSRLVSPRWFIVLAVITFLSLLSAIWHGSKKEFIPSVAVLPLHYSVQGQQLSEKSVHVTTLLISDLKRLETLYVFPYSTVSPYSDDVRPCSDIYREIESSYIVRGVVSELEDILRFDLKLLDGKTGELISYLADESFHSEKEKTLGYLAVRINDTIYSGLTPAHRKEISLNEESFDFLSPSLMADTYHLDSHLTGVRQNELFQLLRESLSRDYVSAVQYLRNSDLYWGRGVWDRLPPAGSVALLEEAERLILKHTPDSSYIDLGRGVLSLIYKGSISDAETHFYRAFQSGLEEPSLYRWLMVLEMSKGDMDEAFKYLEMAEERDPLNHLNQVYQIALLYYSGSFKRTVEIVEYYQKSRSNPHSIPELYKARAFLALGDLANAQKTLQFAISLNKQDLALAFQGYAFARTSRRDLAEEIMGEVTSHTCKAIVAAGLGDRNLFDFHMEEARRFTEVPYLWLRNDPLLTIRE